MEITEAVPLLAALAQETRLAIFRLLVQAGEEGLSVGTIAQRLGLAAGATLSFHLKELVRTGLARARQEGRFIYYSANYREMVDLLRFLTDNCCGGLGCAEVVAGCEPGDREHDG